MRMLAVLTALIFGIVAVSAATNITTELDKDPNYSEFNNILSTSGIAKDINSRNSITVAALTNQQIDQLRGNLQSSTATSKNVEKELADLCRVQVFLSYISPDDQTKQSIGTNLQVTSMYQTTGNAPGQEGIANITVDKAGNFHLIMSGTNATITKSVKQIGYNLSIIELSNPLVPPPIIGLAPAPSPPPAPVPAPAPVPVAPAPAASVPAGSSPAKSTPASDSSTKSSAGKTFPSSLVAGLASLLAIGFGILL